jgi:hypothetical protein
LKADREWLIRRRFHSVIEVLIIDIFRKILIYKTTICCGCPTKRKIHIFTGNQKTTQLQIIEIIQASEIVKIISNIKVIYATHRSFSIAAKSEFRKIWPPTI